MAEGYCRSREGTEGTGEALAAVGGRNGARSGSRGTGGKMGAKKAPCLHTVQEDMEYRELGAGDRRRR